MNLLQLFKGKFVTSAQELQNKLNLCKAFIFDWDGVFNQGNKNENHSSSFNEIDSMGTNLLRFHYYLKNNSLPFVGIISGANNLTAITLTDREKFDALYIKTLNKKIALDHFCKNFNITPQEIVYVFDDVLDFSIAEKVGTRIMIPHNSISSLTLHFAIQNNLVDYITAATSGNFAVREACEILMVLQENAFDTFKERMNYTDLYKNYFSKRQLVNCNYFTLNIENEIINFLP